MIVLNEEELSELISNKRLALKVEVQGYDVFEYVNSGFYKGMFRVHGKSLFDVPELDDNDNVISVKKAGTYEKTCVRPRFIKYACPFTKGEDVVDVYNNKGENQFSVLTHVEVSFDDEKYYWNIDLTI